MVGSINANENSANTFEAFKAKAIGTAATPTSSVSGSTSGGGSGTPTGTTSPTQSKGAASPRFAFQAGGGVGMAFAGLALGLVL